MKLLRLGSNIDLLGQYRHYEHRPVEVALLTSHDVEHRVRVRVSVRVNHNPNPNTNPNPRAAADAPTSGCPCEPVGSAAATSRSFDHSQEPDRTWWNAMNIQSSACQHSSL